MSDELLEGEWRGTDLQDGIAMNPWYCLDCNSVVELDKHGRCEVCQSSAVDHVFREVAVTVKALTVEELERLFDLSK